MLREEGVWGREIRLGKAHQVRIRCREWGGGKSNKQYKYNNNIFFWFFIKTSHEWGGDDGDARDEKGISYNDNGLTRLRVYMMKGLEKKASWDAHIKKRERGVDIPEWEVNDPVPERQNFLLSVRRYKVKDKEQTGAAIHQSRHPPSPLTTRCQVNTGVEKRRDRADTMSKKQMQCAVHQLPIQHKELSVNSIKRPEKKGTNGA